MTGYALRPPTAVPAAAAALVCAAVVAGCGAVSSSSSSTSGVSGGPGSSTTGTLHIVATEGPTCPVQHQGGPPCVAPYEGKVSITTSSGAPVTDVSTGADGTVDVRLPAGKYTVNGPQGNGGVQLPRLAPAITVEVTVGGTVTVTLFFDTGIR